MHDYIIFFSNKLKIHINSAPYVDLALMEPTGGRFSVGSQGGEVINYKRIN